MQRLLVSVRGPNEAVAAAKSGAHSADVEYPRSALGTPYPLNIKAVRRHLDEHGFKEVPISTNTHRGSEPSGLAQIASHPIGFTSKRSLATQKKTLG